MNPQWNTPPNGDFASYVERLSAQAALPRRAPEEGEHALDVGMTPSSESSGSAAAAASALRRSMQSNGAPAALGVADIVRRFAAVAAQGLRTWADEAARKQAQQNQQAGKKK